MGLNYTSEQREAAFWAKVHKTDGCWPYDCWLWMGAHASGYGVFSRGGGRHVGHMGAHVFSWMLVNGDVPIGPNGRPFEIDHRQTCPKNCVNPDHLIAVPHKRNQENRAGLQHNNTSGVRGVYWNKQRGKWHARAQHNEKHHHAGYWSTLEAAAIAVQEKRKELGFHEH